MRPTTLLRRAADVTPEWLTDALAGAGVLAAGARVTSFEAEPIGTGQMADTTRFALTSTKPGPGPPAWSASSPRPTTRAAAPGWRLRAYEIEVRFYREVAARVAARVPAAYVAEVEPETGWFTLLLEDIAGAVQGDQIDACGPDVAAAVLEEMAGLHAPCWEEPDLAGLEWLNRATPESDAFLTALVASLLPGFLERYEDTLAPEHRDVCRLFAEHLPAYLSLRTGPAHGQPRRLPARQPALPAAATRGRWSSTGRPRPGRRVTRRGLLHRRLPQRRGPPGPRDGPVGPLPRRPVPARRPWTTRWSSCGRTPGRDTFGGVLMAIVASMVVQRTERGDLMFLDQHDPPRAARARRRRARAAPRRRMTDLLVLCTGNAARSVMAGFMLEHLRDGRPGDPLHIVTAGTHTIDGQPMGMRTRAALSRLPELADADFRRHRSRQVHGVDLVHAELVVVMEADHVRFVRRQFPDAAAKTATIRHVCRDLAPAPPGLGERVAALGLAEVEVSDDEDVLDPAGHEADVYAACVDELWGLCRTLVTLL